MSKILAAIARKTLGLTLIFNSLVSLASVSNILISFYFNGCTWKPFSPYLIDGSLFWFTILTAFLNIAPAKLIGKVDMKRVLFHHYVYGFMSIFTSLLLVALFAPAYIFILLTPYQGFQTTGFQLIPIYAGLFFMYGGLTLVVDDIYDMPIKMGRIFDKLKMKMFKLSDFVQSLHFCSSFASIYVTISAAIWYFENRFWLKNWPLWNIAHIVFISNLFVTSVWGLKIVRGKLWFNTLKNKSVPEIEEKS
ncbi:MAG: hypothetical protein QXX08_07545 [Candidatus Bathyarchaeia archaeon]